MDYALVLNLDTLGGRQIDERQDYAQFAEQTQPAPSRPRQRSHGQAYLQRF